MLNKLWTTTVVLTSVLILSACQTTITTPSKDTLQYEKIMTMQADIPDSDGDGVPDDIDECPETLPHTAVDSKGCAVVLTVGGLEMEFRGYFPPMSSQLPTIYKPELEKVVDKLNEYPDANIFIFGHVASNETNKDSLANFGFESLPRNRALIVKNMLIMSYGIAPERVRTYDCSDRYPFTESNDIEVNSEALDLRNIESIDSRVNVMATTAIDDLKNLKYDYYIKMYSEYSKRCDIFE
jgi:OOP family OmpA-OmpF porin